MSIFFNFIYNLGENKKIKPYTATLPQALVLYPFLTKTNFSFLFLFGYGGGPRYLRNASQDFCKANSSLRQQRRADAADAEKEIHSDPQACPHVLLEKKRILQ